MSGQWMAARNRAVVWAFGLGSAMLLAACGSSSPPADTAAGSAGGSDAGGTPGTVGTIKVGCDWVLLYDPSRSDLADFAFPETSARYWVAVGPSAPAAGDRFDIAGRYPGARYSSLTVYNGNGGYEDSLADYLWRADVPGGNPFSAATTRNPAGQIGAGYTDQLLFDTAVPAAGARAPNTLYRPSPGLTDGDRKKRTLLMYRTYLPQGGNDGGVGLPVLSFVSGGVRTPLSQTPDTAECSTLYANFIQQFGGGGNRGGLDSIPIFRPPLPTPRLEVFRGVAGGVAGKGQFYNADNNFMSTTTSTTYGELLLVRGRAPTYTDQPGVGTTPDVRFWSLCENEAQSQKVVACVHDENAALDATGFYTLVIAADNQPEPAATAARGYNVLPFGSQTNGEVIYRQLLAAPGYAQGIDKVGPLQNAQTVMGDAYPQATYCSRATFEAAASSPAAAFAACQAALP